MGLQWEGPPSTILGPVWIQVWILHGLCLPGEQHPVLIELGPLYTKLKYQGRGVKWHRNSAEKMLCQIREGRGDPCCVYIVMVGRGDRESFLEEIVFDVGLEG